MPILCHFCRTAAKCGLAILRNCLKSLSCSLFSIGGSRYHRPKNNDLSVRSLDAKIMIGQLCTCHKHLDALGRELRLNPTGKLKMKSRVERLQRTMPPKTSAKVAEKSTATKPDKSSKSSVKKAMAKRFVCSSVLCTVMVGSLLCLLVLQYFSPNFYRLQAQLIGQSSSDGWLWIAQTSGGFREAGGHGGGGGWFWPST